jgi:hypothetical protein
MFSPANNLIGEATGLWRPVPRSPTLLALAIKQLEAQTIFEPCEAELRKALDEALQKVNRLKRLADEWLTLLRESDAWMFEHDRDGWRAAHAAVNAHATIALIVEFDQSPHQEALNEVWEPKFYRENPEQLELERAARQAKLDAQAD